VTFASPLALLLLLVVPIVLGAYLWQLRRKRKQAVRFSSVELIRAAIPRRSRWRRHVPVALFLASIAGLALATARPNVSVEVALGRTSIILALDVSRSMCATDIQPNRMAVAQDAARTFVKDQVAGTRIGIVAFAGLADLVMPPTTDKKKLIDVIDGLTTARGTVIGTATLKAIDAIAAVNPDVAPVGTDLRPDQPTGNLPPIQPPPDGDYVPDIIVLLTDGANTRGIEPLVAAQEAANRRIRVYTIGFGTTNPTEMVCTREQVGADVFGEGGFGGGGFPPGGGGPGGPQFLLIDEPTLQGVADLTGGEFFRAEDADQLRGVFANLPNQITLQSEDQEISVVFAILGAVLAVGALALGLLWNRSS
jgi:Ca-activated chloride channel family protein